MTCCFVALLLFCCLIWLAIRPLCDAMSTGTGTKSFSQKCFQLHSTHSNLSFISNSHFRDRLCASYLYNNRWRFLRLILIPHMLADFMIEKMPNSGYWRSLNDKNTAEMKGFWFAEFFGDCLGDTRHLDVIISILCLLHFDSKPQQLFFLNRPNSNALYHIATRIYHPIQVLIITSAL